jgi:hypothetical protein
LLLSIFDLILAYDLKIIVKSVAIKINLKLSNARAKIVQIHWIIIYHEDIVDGVGLDGLLCH